MSKWWEQDMAGSALQIGQADPNFAVQAATVPDSFLSQVAMQSAMNGMVQEAKDRQKDKQGFLGTIASTLGTGYHKVGGWISDIPLAGDFMHDAIKKGIIAPLDKAASDLWWIQSNVVSQPLATVILAQGEKDLNDKSLFDASTWSDAYHKAENISPAQAATNIGNVVEARKQLGMESDFSAEMKTSGLARIMGDVTDDIGKEEARKIVADQERYIYDTAYWRKRDGWKYTVGTGFGDGIVTVALDAPGAMIGAGAKAYKAARNIKVITNAQTGDRVVQRSLPWRSGNSVDTAIDGGAIDQFVDWMGSGNRSVGEIEAHPIWGAGRRKNHHVGEYAQFLYGKDADTIKHLMGFFAGGRNSLADMVAKSRVSAAELGVAMDNRKLVSSARIDPDMLEYYRTSGQAINDGTIDPLKLYEPPVPRPTTAGPMQDAWDARWKPLADLSEMHRQAAAAVAATPRIRPLVGSMEPTRLDDIQMAETWQKSALEQANLKYEELLQNDDFYSRIFDLSRDVEGAVKGTGSSLFGSLDEFHRMGTLAMRDANKAATKIWEKKFKTRQWYADSRSGGVGGLASQVIRTGMYSAPIRVVQAIGDLMPPGFINHTENGATGRVSDMLRYVKTLTPAERESWTAGYSNAVGKVERSRELERIHLKTIGHVAKNHGIDAEVALEIYNKVAQGHRGTMAKLTGGRNQQVFSGLEDPMTGNRLDIARVRNITDDGEALVAAPLLESQLAQGDALLNVKELDRVLARHARAVRSVRDAGGDVAEAMGLIADGLSSVWKASSLLRAGFVIRNVSESTGAMMAKMGLLTAMAGVGSGSWDFFRNRGLYIKALAGHGSSVPTTGAREMSRFARVRLENEDLVNAQAIKSKLSPEEAAQIKTKRIQVPEGLRVAERFHAQENKHLARVDGEIKALRDSLDERYGRIGTRAKLQDSLDNASAALGEAYARTSRLRIDQSEAAQLIIGKRHAGPEGVPIVRDDGMTQANSVDDLTDLFNESEHFLREAEQSAADSATKWGDSNWKYQAEQLDALRAWRETISKEMRKGEIFDATRAAAHANAEEVAARRVAEFSKVMEGLTSDKDWWATALTAAERHEAEMHRDLGEAASRLHYYDDNLDKQALYDDQKKLAELLLQKQEHQTSIREFADYAAAILRTAEKSAGHRFGEGTYTYRGIVVPEAYSPLWQHAISRDEVTSEIGHQVQWARYESTLRNRQARHGSWTEIKPHEEGYKEAWMHILNRQFLNDRGMRRLLNDPDEYRAWLRTGEGRNYRLALGPHGEDVDDLIRKQQILADKYIPDETLKSKLANGEQVYWPEVDAASGLDKKPVVYGEEVHALNPLTRKDSMDNALHNTLSRMFNRFSTIPTDILVNHPVFAKLQRANMQRLIDDELAFRTSKGLPDKEISLEQMNRMYEQSANKARSDMKTIVYDPQRTSATEGMRFVFPFLAAHVDGLQRWFGLLGEKPQLANTISKIYNTPVAGNMVTDRNGRLVDKDGNVTIRDENGKVTGKEFVGMTDRVFHLRMPGASSQQTKGGIPIPIQNMNVFMPGDPWFNPGFGPAVQLSGSLVADASPQAGDFLEWAKVLPFGPTSAMQAVTPKWMRSLSDAWAAQTDDEKNEKFGQAMLTIYNKDMARWKEGGSKGKAPTLEGTKDEARKFMFLQTLSAFASPAQTTATPLTGTPYQFYVDQYNQLLQADPENAKDIFYEKYGESYYQFTTSLSKSIGIAPTMEALQKTGEFKDMLNDMPEMAGFMIGKTDKSKFSRTAYLAQFNQMVGGKAVREKLTPQEAIDLNEADIGWKKYGQITDMVDSMLIERGLKSYSQKDAADLARLKSILVDDLAKEHPAWEKEYSSIDRGKVQRTIGYFTRLMDYKPVAKDPMRAGEMDKLATYLQVRSLFKSQLDQLGVQQINLDVGGNPNSRNPAVNAIANQWHNFVLQLREQDLDFASTYNRYLSRDQLQ